MLGITVLVFVVTLAVSGYLIYKTAIVPSTCFHTLMRDHLVDMEAHPLISQVKDAPDCDYFIFENLHIRYRQTATTDGKRQSCKLKPLGAHEVWCRTPFPGLNYTAFYYDSAGEMVFAEPLRFVIEYELLFNVTFFRPPPLDNACVTQMEFIMASEDVDKYDVEWCAFTDGTGVHYGDFLPDHEREQMLSREVQS